MFEFTPIIRVQRTAYNLPDNIVRITKQTIQISANMSNRFKTFPHETKKSGTAYSVSFAYDKRNQALKIEASDGQNSFSLYQKTQSDSLSMTSVPVGLVREGVLTGDYLLVEGTANIFKLVP